MASVSNSFDALLGATTTSRPGEGKKRNRKRNKAKQDNQASHADSAPSMTPQPAVPPNRRSAPSAAELEAKAGQASTHQERLELWHTWSTNSAQSASFSGPDEQPVIFREVLLASRAIEVSIETCLDQRLNSDHENEILEMLDAILRAVNPEIVRTITAAIVRLSNSLSNASPDVVVAAKSAVSGVLAALKKADALSNHPQKKPVRGLTGSGHSERSKTGGRSAGSNAPGSELKEAIEGFRRCQEMLDAFSEEEASVGRETRALYESATRTLSDFKTVVIMSGQPIKPSTSTEKPKSKKGKGGGIQGVVQASPVLESIGKQEAALEEEAASLMAEIASVETHLSSLNAQLRTVNEAKERLIYRKNTLTDSLQNSGAVPQSAATQDEQLEAAKYLEVVMSALQGGDDEQPSGHQDSLLSGYLEAALKLLQTCVNKQDDIMKNVKFLKDCIQRKYATEKNLLAMAAQVGDELLNANRSQRDELEKQLQGAIKEAEAIAVHSQKIQDGIKSRGELFESSTWTAKNSVEEFAARVLRRHKDILGASRARNDEQPKGSVPVPAKKKVDVDALIKQAEGDLAHSLQSGSQRSRQRGQPQRSPLTSPSPQPRDPSQNCLPTDVPCSVAHQPKNIPSAPTPVGVQGPPLDAHMPMFGHHEALRQAHEHEQTLHAMAAYQQPQPQPIVNSSKVSSMAPGQMNSQHGVAVVPMGGTVANQPLGFNQPMVAHQGWDLGISDTIPPSDYRLPVPVHPGSLPDAPVQSNGAMASTSSGRGWRVINPVSPMEMGKPASPTPAEAREQGLLGRNRIAKKS